MDLIASFRLSFPRFEDDLGYYEDRNIETEFAGFNGSLDNLRKQLGEERYVQARALSDEMKAHFEADPDDVNGRADKGLDCLYAIEDLVRAARRRKPKAPSDRN